MRLVSGGAEEAGMKGWRERSRIPPKCAKARFTRVSRGLAPQVYRQDNPHSRNAPKKRLAFRREDLPKANP